MSTDNALTTESENCLALLADSLGITIRMRILTLLILLFQGSRSLLHTSGVSSTVCEGKLEAKMAAKLTVEETFTPLNAFNRLHARLIVN